MEATRQLLIQRALQEDSSSGDALFAIAGARHVYVEGQDDAAARAARRGALPPAGSRGQRERERSLF